MSFLVHPTTNPRPTTRTKSTMRFTISSVFITTVAVAASRAAAFNETFLEGLLNELTSLNLTTLVGAATSIANIPAGVALLDALSNGKPATLLAPTNFAWAGVNPAFSGNPDWVAQALAYHIIPEHVNVSSIARVPQGGTSVHPTLLTDPSIVYLDGKPQNINFNLDPTTNKTVIVSNQDKFFPVIQATHTYQNIQILTISSVVDLPPSLYFALQPSTTYPWVQNLTTLTSTAPASALQNITNTPATTFFAPTNEAFANAAAGYGGLPTSNGALNLNESEWATLLQNHAIFGSVVFSGAKQTNFTSGAGETITVGTGGAYGNAVYYKGEVVANIIRADIVTQSGVLHIIDAVLPNLARGSGTGVVLTRRTVNMAKKAVAEPVWKKTVPGVVEAKKRSSRFWGKQRA